MHITVSMGQNNTICSGKIRESVICGGFAMNEKIYKTMSRTGACSIAVGIVTLVTGITAGVLMIVSGSRLLKRKSDILI